MDLAALRILDANLNRCREALRTAEDFARFARNDAGLAADFKALRHDLSDTTRHLAAQAVAARDTPGDVGTALSTPQERSRTSLGAVAVAACKRASEALRVVEEVAKLADPAVAAVVKQLRYRLYEHERCLAARVSVTGRIGGVRVYVLVTESVCLRGWRETAESAVAGGADALQLREPELPDGELLRRARILRTLCRDAGVVFIVNNRPDVAVLSGADGVHVGQDDLPPAEVRKVVGPDALVGVSTHRADHLVAAWRAGADYVGIGPVFPSTTKPRDFLPGLGYAREAAEMNLLPTVAIAGITPANAADVWATGVSIVAAASSVTMSDDVAAAVRALRPPEPHADRASGG